MLNRDTIIYNEAYLQGWGADSDMHNSRVFFCLSQEAEGKIHVYHSEEIPKLILIRNIESVLEALKKSGGDKPKIIG